MVSGKHSGTDNDVSDKNRWTSQYLHIEHGYLQMGPIQPGWHSAMWSFRHSAMGGSIFNIQNHWKGTFLHIEYGRLEIGNIQPGWHTPDGRQFPFPDDKPGLSFAPLMPGNAANLNYSAKFIRKSFCH